MSDASPPSGPARAPISTGPAPFPVEEDMSETMSIDATENAAFQEPEMPQFIRLLGGRWKNGRRSYQMKWGELSFGRKGWACQLHLFSDPPHFSLHFAAFWISVFIALPFLRRWTYEPPEMMDSWGFSYGDLGSLFLRWAHRVKIVHMPWHDWSHVSHEVRRPDGSWVPAVGSWERDKAPDGRHLAVYPYRYLLRSGERQEVNATVSVERRIWRLKWLRWTRLLQRQRYAIEVEFDGEIGEGTGSWKGGTIGCGYEMRPGETPRACLRRMEQERRF